MQAFSEAAGAGPDVQRTWRATIDCLIEPGVAHLGMLIAQGRADCERPDETIRALSVLIDRYLLDIYGRSSAVDIDEPVAVLAQIWRRTLRLR